MDWSMRHPKPYWRRLRVFAVDPGLKTELVTADLNCVEVEIPWEKLPPDGSGNDPDSRTRPESAAGTGREPAPGPAPGPVGEYIAVVDYDPASGLIYAPVDINQPYLLEQHGLAPWEGDPQFHQQMVYAVCMKTIQRFNYIWRAGHG